MSIDLIRLEPVRCYHSWSDWTWGWWQWRVLQSSSMTGSPPSDCLCWTFDGGGSLTPLQRCSRCILHPQPTGLRMICIWGWCEKTLKCFFKISFLYLFDNQISHIHIFFFAGQRYGKYSVSGFPASIARYPSAVYLESPGTKCTGTLISKQFILTAAHCLYVYLCIFQTESLVTFLFIETFWLIDWLIFK